ncbi:MAG TPA: ectoine hydroxylase [Nitrosopumilaceae archaeon]|nr:ectoine hydroxylase [Nitrosopumilaceae archaeon]
MSSKTIQDLYPTRIALSPSILERKDPVVYPNNLQINALTKEDVDFFEKNGYLFFKNLFNQTEVNMLKTELEKLANDEKAKNSEQYVTELESGDVRSIFEIHKHNQLFKELSNDKRIVDVIRQLLGSDVYVTQSRINRKPGFEGKEFYWHSDFETWHAEDGMPRMRAISCSINLTENFEFNGPLMVIPGSHKLFISCIGRTPENHYKTSLKKQEIGTPDKSNLEKLAKKNKIVSTKGPAGSALFFDCNIMHGSAGNITPYSRSNVFFVYNSIENQLTEPFSAKNPRPEYIASREVKAVNPKTFDINKFLN